MAHPVYMNASVLYFCHERIRIAVNLVSSGRACHVILAGGGDSALQDSVLHNGPEVHQPDPKKKRTIVEMLRGNGLDWDAPAAFANFGFASWLSFIQVDRRVLESK